MVQITYDKTKQHYLDQLEILNGKAFDFYLRMKKRGYSEEIIREKIWRSEIWTEAKILFKELNTHLYGKLTCEMCFTGFYSKKLYSFQLHHTEVKYNWKKVFDPENTSIIHKRCHMKKHGIER